MAGDPSMIQFIPPQRDAHGREDRVDRVTAGIAHHRAAIRGRDVDQCGEVVEDGAASFTASMCQRTAGGLFVVVVLPVKPAKN